MANAKQTKQDGEDTKLILYRLSVVEKAVTNLGTKLDKQDNIKRQDLIDFRETLVTRIVDMKADLQKQIDAKADQDSVDDLKKLIGALGGFFLSVAAALFIYVLTKASH